MDHRQDLYFIRADAIGKYKGEAPDGKFACSGDSAWPPHQWIVRQRLGRIANELDDSTRCSRIFLGYVIVNLRKV